MRIKRGTVCRLAGGSGTKPGAAGLLFSGALLVLFWSCGAASGQGRGPAAQPAERPPCAIQPASIAVQQGKGPQLNLPASPEAWAILIQASGGFSGMGAGGIHITSRGVIRPAVPRFVVPSGSLASLNAAVIRSTPDRWRACYERTDVAKGRGCCDTLTDQLSHTLTMDIRRDGQEQLFLSTWSDDAGSLLPPDLREIYRAAWSIKQDSLRPLKER
jgi:hypothetical protein